MPSPPNVSRFLDDQQRHIGPVAGHGERGKRAGQAAARDHDSVPPAPRHSRRLNAIGGLGATPCAAQPHFGTVRGRAMNDKHKG